MLTVLLEMGLMIGCGWFWRLLQPAGLAADPTRRVLTAVVYYLFLPGLILKLMSSARLGLETLKISLYGVAVFLSGAGLAWLWIRFRKIPASQAGALWLAVSFPNVTFLGLPILSQTFGEWASLVVIQLDMFAFTPLVLTFGVTGARIFGKAAANDQSLTGLIRVPPLWAALVAIGLNLLDWRWPDWTLAFLGLLAQGVTPLMLLSLGLALDWRTLRPESAPFLIPVILLKLFLMPLFGWWLAIQLGFSGQKLAALVLEAGMPSMLFGIVLCDRFRLDSCLYAMLVMVSTVLAMATLPFWYGRLLD